MRTTTENAARFYPVGIWRDLGGVRPDDCTTLAPWFVALGRVWIGHATQAQTCGPGRDVEVS